MIIRSQNPKSIDISIYIIYFLGSKSNVTTPNRMDKRSNLRKRALIGKSKTAAPVPPAKKDIEKFASTATRSNLASSSSHRENRLKSMY